MSERTKTWEGKWLTVWVTRPPRKGQTYIVRRDRWFGSWLRIVWSWEAV